MKMAMAAQRRCTQSEAWVKVIATELFLRNGKDVRRSILTGLCLVWKLLE